MDVYIYKTTEGEFLHTAGVTDRISKFSVERLICGGDRLKAEFFTGGNCREIIKPERIIEIPDIFSGLITEIKRSEDGEKIEVSAVSVSGLLSRRILAEYENGDSFMTIIEKNCGAAAGEKRRFPNTYIDKSADCLFVPSKEYRKKSLSRSIAAVIDKGFRICSDIVHGEGAKIRLYGRYTADLSVGSGAELPVILSTEYETLGRQSYSYSEKGTVSGAYIYTDAKNSGDNSIEEWSSFFGEAEGYGRCEEAYEIEPVIRYNASIVGDEIVYTPSLDYPATISAAEDLFFSRYSPPSEVVSAPLGSGMVRAAHSGIIEVGDKVTLYPDENGKDSARRINKIIERYENGEFTMSVYLGNLT